MDRNGMIECVKVKYMMSERPKLSTNCKICLSSLLSQLLGLKEGEEVKAQYNVSLLYV